MSILTLTALVSLYLGGSPAQAATGDISTHAGTWHFSGDGGAATSAQLDGPRGVALDASGNLIIADSINGRVRKVTSGGSISTIGGTGTTEFGGDGGPALTAKFYYPKGVALDASGNVFIADTTNHRIRKIDTGGTITTVAGTGTAGSTGDGGPATSALLSSPADVEVDSGGNLFIADDGNHKIRKVTSGGTISTFAGTGASGNTGDGLAATSATLNNPEGVEVDSSGNVYIADTDNNRVRKVNTSNVISNYAGASNGQSGSSGDGGAATSARLDSPEGVEIDASGNLFISDTANHKIRQVTSGGTISTFAGTGSAGFSGDSGAATSAQLYSPRAVAITGSTVYIADVGNDRVRRVVSGTITTYAGNGVTFGGDGGAAASGELSFPFRLGSDGAGGYYVGDSSNNRIRRVTSGGVISTFAGTGTPGSLGDGGAATSAQLTFPTDIVRDSSGNVYIADYGNHKVRKVTSGGVISTFAGTGTAGSTGDTGPATAATLRNPAGLAIDSAGFVYIADSGNDRIRRVNTSGIISNYAGTGTPGFLGDGGPAASARLNSPFDVDFDTSGNLLIADSSNSRIRSVNTAGTISTVAGSASPGFFGDGGPATSAGLFFPLGVGAGPSGSFFIADSFNGRIRKVDAGGSISTVAGIGQFGFSGDGGAGPSARVNFPSSVAVVSGNVLVADSSNDRIRRIESVAVQAPPIVTGTNPASPANNNSPFVLGSADPGTTVKLYTDSSCTSAIAATGTAAAFASPGLAVAVADNTTTTFYGTATDGGGTVSACSSTFITYVEDSAPPPAPSIDSSPANPTSSTSAAFTFSDTEGGVTFECQLDAGGWSSCSSPKNYSGLSETSHTFDVRAKDAAGNTSSATSFTWTIDTTAPPAPSIDSNPPDPSNSTGATFTFSDTEGGVSFQCQIDGGGFSSCSSPKSYGGLSEASHTFDVKALDAAGNQSSVTSFTWTIDTTPPAAPAFTSAPPDPSSDPNPSWAFTAEPGSSISCKLTRGVTVVSDWTACSSPRTYDLTLEPDGFYALAVRATDAAGNTGPEASSGFTLDRNAPPTPSIDSAPPDPSSSAGATFTFSDTEGGVTYECRIDGGAWAPCTSPKSYAGLSEGSHTFEVRALDAAGNMSGAASYTWTIDTTAPPTPSIDSAPPDPSSSAGATFTFSDTEGGVTYECRIDGGAWGACTSPKSYAGLSEGSHTFEVRALDAAGNMSGAASYTWTIDTTAPPTPSIDSAPPDPSNSTGATFTFSDTEGGVTYECRIDGGAWGACTSPKSYAGLSEGSHTFEVRALDAAGNMSGAASYTWTIDTTAPPGPSIDSAPPDPSNSTGATFTFSDTEGGVTYECRIDGGAWAPCTSPKSYAGLSEGSHTFEVRALDAAGNMSGAASYTWTIDTTAPPTPSIDSAPPDPSNSTGATFTFSDSEGGVTYECRIDGGAWGACTSPKSYAGLSEGSHTFEVRALDAAGNMSGAASYTWTIDTTAPPAPSIDSSPANPTNSTGATFTFSDSEGGVTYECRIDGGAWGACTSPKSYAGLSEGSHTFEVRALDAAGNMSGAASYTWTIDTTAPPTPSIDSAPPDPSNSTGATFTFSDTEGGVTYECRIDGGAWGACTSPKSYAGLSEGSHTFEVRALDAAGNMSGAASYTWTIDTTAPPTPSIDSAPPDPSNSTGATFTFSDTEGGVTYECRIDGGAWGACTSPKSYAGLSEGSHTFEVRALDAAGNMSGAASYTWTIDTTAPPTPSIDSAPPDPSNSTGATFTFSDTEGGVTYECRIDGGAWGACTSPKSYAGLLDGVHTFEVRAIDGVGNVSAAASYTWTIDTTIPPAPSIDSSPTDPTNSTGATFTFSDTEPGVTFECRIDGGAWGACTSPHSYVGLAEGSHTFSVRAKNGAGSTSAPTSFTWTIDTTAPPAPAIDSGPSDPTNSTSASFTFSDTEPGVTFECQLDGGGWSACTSRKAYAGLSEGSHTFEVRALDAAGNVSGSTSFTWEIDTTAPPAPSIDSGPSDPTNSTGATFSFSDTEGGVTYECRIDGGAWGACTSPKSYAGLSDGSHTFEVRALDAAGNVSGSTSFTWTIDLTPPPAPSIDSNPANPTNSTGATFTFSDTEGGVTYECRIDGGAWGACSSPKSYAGLAEGSHTFEVRALDAAGNVSGSTSFTWTIDLTPPPAPSIDSNPANPTNSTGATFTFSDTEGGVTYECRIDGSAWSACSSPKAYAGLSEGSHTFEVRAKDAAGNVSGSTSFTWEIDTTAPPAPSIDSGPADPTNSTSASFTFSDTEPGVTYECQLDGGGWSACSSPKAYAGLSEGSHTFEVRAKDAAGNVSGSTSFTWEIDTTAPPAPSIDSGQSDPTNSTSASFTFSDTEPGVTFECQLDGGGWSACTSPKAYAGLSEGSHTFEVRAIDAAGNVSGSTSFTWEIDTTAPPAPSIDSGPSDPTNSTSASFTFSNTEPGVTYECQLDGGGWSACTSPKAYAGLSEGSHTFEVRALDAAGNVSGATSFTWTIDTTAPPAPSIDSGPSDPTNSTSASFTFSDTEPGVTYECQLDGGGWSACTSPKSYAGLTEGSHTFEVRALDAAGNASSSTSYTWTIDLTPPPAPSINSGPANPTNSTSASFTFSDTEGGVTYECRIDGGGWSACTSPKAYVGLSEGSHTFEVRALDAAGNVSGSTSFTWEIDTTAPPAPSIDSGPADPTNSTSASFTFSDTEPGVTYECRIDGAAWSACISPKSYAGLTEGSHTFEVRALDAAGNASSSTSFTWTIDLTPPPAPSIDSNPANPTNSTGATFTFSDTEGGVTYECRIDGGAWGDCTSPKSYAGLAEGSHTFEVRALDAAGNASSSTSFTWTIDLTPPPAPSIDSNPANPTNSTGATFTFSDTEGGVTYECRIDGGAWGACTSPKSYAGLSEGSHTFEVRALDAAGNVSGSTSFTWTIDLTPPPAPSIDSNPANPTNSTGATFTFSDTEGGVTYECRIDGGAWAPCTSPKSYAGLSEGSHTFEVRALDAAGNISGAASFTWTIDLTPPPAPSIDSNPANPTNSTGATFTFSDTEGGVTYECRIDGGAWGDCTSPKSYAGLSQGSHTFEVRALDAAGNASSSTSFTWTIDLTPPPAPSIDSNPANPTNSTGATFTFSDTEGGVTYECRIDGGAWGACTSPKSYAGLSEGSHTFEVRALDAAGNVSGSTSFTWTIDLTPPPAPSIDSNPANPTNSTSATFTFSDTEGGVTYECRIDGGAWAPCISPKAYAGLSEGTHTFEVRAADAVGNVSPVSSFTWTIDTTPPAAPAFTSVPADPSNDVTPTWSFTTEPGSTVECKLTRGLAVLLDWTPCSSPFTFDLSSEPEGTYLLSVRSTDGAGNTGAENSDAFTLDVTPPPVPTINSGPPSSTHDMSASFTFSNSEGGVTYECRIDSGAWSACTSPKSYSGLALGGHTFQVRARDAAGNTSGPASFSWTIVNNEPVALSDSATSSDGSSVEVSVLENDVDADGDPLSIASWTQGVNGSVTCSGTTCTYTPNEGFSGTDSFTYTISDGRGGTSSGTVQVEVLGVRDESGGGAGPNPLNLIEVPPTGSEPTEPLAVEPNPPAPDSPPNVDVPQALPDSPGGLAAAIAEVFRRVIEFGPEVVTRSMLPMALLALIVFFFLIIQNRIDRKDPKLALAPVDDEPYMVFE